MRSILPGLARAGAIFLASRLVVVAALWFALNFVTHAPNQPNPEHQRIYSPLCNWDAPWYGRIAVIGYAADADDTTGRSLAFFPVYPFLVHLVLRLGHPSILVALLLVSNLSGLLAALVLHRLIAPVHGETTADWTVALTAAFPGSLFLSAGYAEGLTLLLSAACFLLLRQRRYTSAAFVAGLASATRPTGILLAPVVAYAMWRRERAALTTSRWLANSALACWGLAAYMSYLWIAKGGPLRFVDQQYAWNSAFPQATKFQVLTLQPFTHLLELFRLGPGPVQLDPWFFTLAAIAIVWGARRLPGEYTLFAVLGLVVPYFTTVGARYFVAFTRYLVPVFPVFLVLAMQAPRRLWLTVGCVVVFAGLLFVDTALFARFYWVG